MSAGNGAAFVPDPDWPSIVELASQRWGQPTSRRQDHVRFGVKGSKDVKLSSNVWMDYETGEGGGYIEMWAAVRKCPLPERRTTAKAPPQRAMPKPARKIAAIYPYHRADGSLALEVVRFASGEPRFNQRRPDGNGGWIWNLDGIPAAERPPYRLPELLAAPPASTVFIPEGEKDVDNIRSDSLIATTNAGGAGKWNAGLNEYLRGHHAILLPDNDDPGRKHAGEIARNLIGIAASVKVLSLPGLPEKGDVSDWLAVGGTAEELMRLAEAASEIAFPDRQPDTDIISLADLQNEVIEPLRWTVPEYLPEGLTVFAGRPKIGKSWLMLNIALAVARGREALGQFVEQGDVLYCGLEDGKRRMKARVEKILGTVRWPAAFTFRRRLAPLDQGGLDTIEQWLTDHPMRRLVVIDVLGRVRGAKRRDEEAYQYDYRILAALQELAIRYRVAIVVVHHVRKSDAEDVLDTISGTTGIAGACDLALVLGRTKHGIRLAGRGRDTEEIDKLVDFDPDTALWSVTGEYDEAVPDSPTAATRRAIYDLLQGSTVPLMPVKIAERLNQQSNVIRVVLGRMLKAFPAQVERNPDGSYTLPSRARA
jgi:hypothetical protein